jgi:thymidylate synthase (FAD)
VLEHANFTFVFHKVSRVFTHELVRHRPGVAVSQESLRYVRLTSLGFRIPDVLEPLADRIVEIVETLEDFQLQAAEEFGLDDDGTPFHVKKEVTSALRRLAPLGLSTEIVWSANVRTLRHVIEARTAAGAEEEIRFVFGEVARQLHVECPLLLADFQCLEDGSWVPQYSKV